MNEIYHDLRELFDKHNVLDPAGGDELSAAVVRQTLHKLFVLETLHPDGRFDVEVGRSTPEDEIVHPDRFTITSYSIEKRRRRYEIELVAEHVEYDYAYEFDGAIQRSGSPSLVTQRARIDRQVSAT
jgi:hypothetical protein